MASPPVKTDLPSPVRSHPLSPKKEAQYPIPEIFISDTKFELPDLIFDLPSTSAIYHKIMSTIRMSEGNGNGGGNDDIVKTEETGETGETGKMASSSLSIPFHNPESSFASNQFTIGMTLAEWEEMLDGKTKASHDAMKAKATEDGMETHAGDEMEMDVVDETETHAGEALEDDDVFGDKNETQQTSTGRYHSALNVINNGPSLGPDREFTVRSPLGLNIQNLGESQWVRSRSSSFQDTEQETEVWEEPEIKACWEYVDLSEAEIWLFNDQIVGWYRVRKPSILRSCWTAI